MADAFEGRRDGVEKEAADEFVGIQGHDFLFVVVLAIAPGEGDMRVGDVKDAMVGNGDAVGVAANVVENDAGTGERFFGVDDPVFFVEGGDQRLKRPGIRKREEAFGMSGLEVVEELAAEHRGERFDGEEEFGV